MASADETGRLNYPTVEEETLLRALRESGDELAFRELYHRHTPRLYQFVLRTLNDVADAEDVVQETWIRAVTSLKRFRGESRFATWLTAIAVNRIGDRLRRRKRWTFDDAALDTLQTTNGSSGDSVDVERALAALPLGYKTVVVLHDMEGYTHEEIAERLGIAVGTSKSQLFHARRALRGILEKVEEPKDV